MICKWCGERIDEKMRVCPSCGHAIPPLSGFMGFQSAASGDSLENLCSVLIGADMKNGSFNPEHIEIQKREKTWVRCWIENWKSRFHL